jgi:DNA-binding NarL/FixJ family response regulator
LLSVSERAEKRAIAERDKFWAPKLEAERKQAEEKQKQANIKLVRKLCIEGWQDIKIAETLELDIETVRLYAAL